MQKEGIIDLHTHTTHSDGELTPKELLTKANNYDLTAISITDHDTIAAYTPETFDIAEKLKVELVPGIEISTTDHEKRKYHILGLLIDIENPDLIDLTAKLKNKRTAYTEQLCDMLIENGWAIDRDNLLTDQRAVTKAHIARSLIAHPHNTKTLKDMFDGRLPREGELIEATMIRGKPYYIESPGEIGPQEAINTIHAASGLAILAHPGFSIMKGENFDNLSKKFVNLGIDGFEAINVQYDRSNNDREVDHIEQLTNFALQNRLVISGGSDFHIDNENTLGKFIDLGFKNDHRKVPYPVLENLREYKEAHRK
jgi:predicted metal-dependent phosphoesterase TrpH